MSVETNRKFKVYDTHNFSELSFWSIYAKYHSLGVTFRRTNTAIDVNLLLVLRIDNNILTDPVDIILVS